ncbi:MAG: ComEC/Rec2 family competence protein, partial [Pseudomonadota bacterium]
MTVINRSSVLPLQKEPTADRHQHGVSPEGKGAAPGRSRRNRFVAVEELGPFFLAVGVCLGAAVTLQLPDHRWTAYLAGGCAGLITLILARFGAGLPKLLRTGLLACLGLSLGTLATEVRIDQARAPVVASEIGPVLVEGWLVDIEPGRSGPRLRLRPHAIAGFDQTGLPHEIRLTHTLSLSVSSGRFVRCYAVIRPPPGPSVPGDYDFRRQAWFEGLGGVGYVQGRCRGGVLGAPPDLATRLSADLGARRRQLATYVKEAAGPRAGGFAAALVSGDRSFMAEADQLALRQSGLAHLLAISGLHLGIVGGLVYLLARRGLGLIEPLAVRAPVQKFAAIAAIVAITLYLVLSGASVSTQRAYIMSSVFFAAILIDRPALSLRSFSIALLLVGLLRPESVVTPGFQMSFAATGVLIALYENWTIRRTGRIFSLVARVRFWAASLVMTSVAASAATAPFAAFHFDRIAPYGLVANLVAMPIVSLASVPAAALSILLTPFGAADIGLRLFGWSLEGVLAVAHTASAQNGPVTSLPSMSPVALSGFIAAIGAMIVFRGWVRAGMVVSTASLAGLMWA